MAAGPDDERDKEMVGPPSAAFRATLVFPVRDAFSSGPDPSELAVTAAPPRPRARPVAPPIETWDAGWDEALRSGALPPVSLPPSPSPASSPAERSTIPAPGDDGRASPLTLDLSGAFPSSERDTALAYASLHGNLQPKPLPADLAPLLAGPEPDPRAEGETARPPPESAPLLADLVAAEERARRAEVRAAGPARAASAIVDAGDLGAAPFAATLRPPAASTVAAPAARWDLAAPLAAGPPAPPGELPAFGTVPPVAADVPATVPPPAAQRRTLFRRLLLPIAASNVVVALAVGVIARVTVPPVPVPILARTAVEGRTPLASEPVPAAAAAGQGCALRGASRELSARAEPAGGLDVSALGSGFAVGIASGATETTALRLEGMHLRIAERVRGRTAAPVQRVAVDPWDPEGLDVRVDTDETRTIVGAPPFRLVARAGSLVAVRAGAVRPLWALPARTDVKVLPPPPPPKKPAFLARLESERTSFDRKARAGKDVKPEVRGPIVVTPPESLRAAALPDGGAVVVLRRPSLLLVGLVDGALAPRAGGLLAIPRKAAVASPEVAPAGAGGAVVWSEKVGPDPVVMGAIVAPDGGETRVVALEALGRGTAPAIAELPGGDLLVAYTEAWDGGHRVVAARFDHELAAKGEPVVVSAARVDAQRPALAVRADGAALVAFFAAEDGRTSVVGAPLACE